MVNSKRSVELDILRAIAIILVLGRHMGDPSAIQTPIVRDLLILWYSCGWVGVDLFFVLSGFLVSGLLFREYIGNGKISVGHFLLRRGFKIYPAFYFFFFATLIINPLLGATFPEQAIPMGVKSPHPAAVVGEALFLQNYIAAIWDHTWSIAVEEHFYILLPLLLILLSKKRNSNPNDPFSLLPRLFVILAVTLYTFRIFMYFFADTSLASIHTLTHFRIDSLFFGVVLSYWFYFHSQWLLNFFEQYSKLILATSIVLLFPLLVPSLESGATRVIWSYIGCYLGFGLLTILAISSKFKSKERILSILAPLAFLGTHSYSLYLWHIPARNWSIILADQWLDLSLGFWGALALYLSTAIILGVVFSITIEQVFLKIRDHFFPSKSGKFKLPTE